MFLFRDRVYDTFRNAQYSSIRSGSDFFIFLDLKLFVRYTEFGAGFLPRKGIHFVNDLIRLKVVLA